MSFDGGLLWGQSGDREESARTNLAGLDGIEDRGEVVNVVVIERGGLQKLTGTWRNILK